MLIQQRIDGKEIGAFGVRNLKTGETGILVHPWTRNSRTETKIPWSAFDSSCKCLKTPNGNNFQVLFFVHTHPEDDAVPSGVYDDQAVLRGMNLKLGYSVPGVILTDTKYTLYGTDRPNTSYPSSLNGVLLSGEQSLLSP